MRAVPHSLIFRSRYVLRSTHPSPASSLTYDLHLSSLRRRHADKFSAQCTCCPCSEIDRKGRALDPSGHASRRCLARHAPLRCPMGISLPPVYCRQYRSRHPACHAWHACVRQDLCRVASPRFGSGARQCSCAIKAPTRAEGRLACQCDNYLSELDKRREAELVRQGSRGALDRRTRTDMWRCGKPQSNAESDGEFDNPSSDNQGRTQSDTQKCLGSRD